MNNDFDKGNEMNNEKMKMDRSLSGKSDKTQLTQRWVGVLGVVLVCASAEVTAQVCQAENDQSVRASERLLAREQARLIGGSGFSSVAQIRAWHDKHRETLAVECTNAQAMVNGYLEKLEMKIKRVEEYKSKGMASRDQIADVEFHVHATQFQLCLVRARLAQCSSSTASATSPGNTGTNRSLPATSTSSANTTPEAKRLNTEMSEATARAEQTQAKVDKAREGKPKRHVAGLEAHNCLKPQTGGGVVNSCPYAVEYSYCVLRPTKGTWSESFDCEKSKGGSWQVGPGPNARSVMHTAGVTTYWFACKYGETLGKPDGVSPADIEYQAGRGLLGRCVQ